MNRVPRCRLVPLLGCLLGFWIAASAAPAHAQESPLIVEGDQVIYDQSAQLVEATGQVRLRYRGIRLTADRVVFDLQRESLTAEGHVVLVDLHVAAAVGHGVRDLHELTGHGTCP